MALVFVIILLKHTPKLCQNSLSILVFLSLNLLVISSYTKIEQSHPKTHIFPQELPLQ